MANTGGGAVAAGWGSAVGLAAVAAAWVYSYVAAGYLDRGRLLVVVGHADDVEQLVYLADGSARSTADARQVLRRPVAWDELADQAIAGQYRGRFVNAGYFYGWGVLDAGANIQGARVGSGGTIWLLAVPIWAGTVPLGATLATVVLIRRRRSRRAVAGRCAACGYDLRGSPGRCPECGAAARPVRDGDRA